MLIRALPGIQEYKARVLSLRYYESRRPSTSNNSLYELLAGGQNLRPDTKSIRPKRVKTPLLPYFYNSLRNHHHPPCFYNSLRNHKRVKTPSLLLQLFAKSPLLLLQRSHSLLLQQPFPSPSLHLCESPTPADQLCSTLLTASTALRTTDLPSCRNSTKSTLRNHLYKPTSYLLEL